MRAAAVVCEEATKDHARSCQPCSPELDSVIISAVAGHPLRLCRFLHHLRVHASLRRTLGERAR